MLDAPGDALNDEEFDIALRWRLGCKFAVQGLRCKHCKANGELCDERLDVYLSHAFTCKCGGTILGIHNGIADVLRECGRRPRQQGIDPCGSSQFQNGASEDHGR